MMTGLGAPATCLGIFYDVRIVAEVMLLPCFLQRDDRTDESNCIGFVIQIWNSSCKLVGIGRHSIT
jgi:hypothetical protein